MNFMKRIGVMMVGREREYHLSPINKRRRLVIHRGYQITLVPRSKWERWRWFPLKIEEEALGLRDYKEPNLTYGGHNHAKNSPNP